MEDTINQLRVKDAKSLRRGIYEGLGHDGKNHSGGVHRAKALSLCNMGIPFHKTLELAYQYADEHDDILALTFSTHLRSEFGSGGCIWFHKELLSEKVRFGDQSILYIK